MPGVHWSHTAEAKLGSIDPAVRDQLMTNACEILHHVPPALYPRDEGFEGKVMWHRGIACGTLFHGSQVQEAEDGPWNYILFYKPRRACPEDSDTCFEILAICGIADIAGQWRRMEGESILDFPTRDTAEDARAKLVVHPGPLGRPPEQDDHDHAGRLSPSLP